MIFPFLLMILHFSQIGFTDDLTFMIKISFQKVTICHYIIIYFKMQGKFCRVSQIFLAFLTKMRFASKISLQLTIK